MKKHLFILALSGLMAAGAQADGVIRAQVGFDTPDTYNEAGFDRNGNHKDTGTPVDQDGYGAQGNLAPVIGTFSASPNSGDAPLTVNFTLDITDDVGTPTYMIDYGDASIGGGLSYTYYTPGSYTAEVTATDEKGLTTSATTSINVTAVNLPPLINSFTATPSSGSAPLNVTFAVNASDDTGTPAIHIDYGDGTDGTSLTHTYAIGNRTATLTVTDDGGLTATMTVNINAINPEPVCVYQANAKWVDVLASRGQWLHIGTPFVSKTVPGSTMPSSYTSGGYTFTKGAHKSSWWDAANTEMHNYYEICYVPAS